jgi:hypothetical protein
MCKEEIIAMVTRELTEKAMTDRRESLNDEESQLHKEVGKLSKQASEIMARLPKEDQDILDSYFVKTNLITDKECAFLYTQGVKDRMTLLKKLGAL